MRLKMTGLSRAGSAMVRRPMRRRFAPAAAASILLAAMGATPVEPASYEPIPILRASDFLGAAMLQGTDYTVDDRVVSDGILNTYTIVSRFGTFQAQSTSLALIRIHEVGAIAQLKEIDKIAVASGAAIHSVIDMGKGTFHLVTNPADAVAGIGGGVSRLFSHIGRGIKRGQEKFDSKGGAPATQPESTGTKVAGASRDAARGLFGVNRAQRFWAEKLHVDPYTLNTALRDQLEEVADYDAGGRFSTKLMPFGVAGTVLGAASTVNDIVWTKDPDEVLTLNESRLTAMGLSPQDSLAFRLNAHYTLAVQARLVASLDSLSQTAGRPEFVDQAAGAQSEGEARFFQQSASMTAMFQRTVAPVIGIVADLTGACVIARGDRFVCLYPVDYIVWTEGVSGTLDRITEYAESNLSAATRELWLTGCVSPRTAQELQRRGWTVRENSMDGLASLESE